jgi:hypothetical protein
VTRSKLSIALIFALAVVSTMTARAGERVSGGGPQWPNVRSEDLPDPTPNPQPGFLSPEQTIDRIMGTGGTDVEVTGSTARWPVLPGEPQPSPFAFEVGARYWFSSAQINFSFVNGDPLFGNPTSTLYWDGLTSHSGEVFARLDHKPSGWFVKGVAGLGTVVDGNIVDRDYLAGQIKFSDTTSVVKDGNLAFAMMDVGWGYSPVKDIHVGFFAGYQFWREKVAAYGLRCNQVSFVIDSCNAVGALPVGYDIAVFNYQPTWHVVRLGFEGRAAITDRWSVSGEIAAIPYAYLQNDDSHLLRSDLGPSPNVVTNSKYAFGLETEMFVNYALTPNIEIGGGLRYWGIAALFGDVRFGPDFANSFAVNDFSLQRYGGLLQVKGKF